jgi:hypothetical protein
MIINFNVNLAVKNLEFYCESSLKYKAHQKNTFKMLLFLSDSFFLLNDSAGNEVAKISNKSGLLKSKYEISFANGAAAFFEGTGGMKSNYILSCKEEKYFLFGHKGNLTSLFQHKKQIGFIKKEKKSTKGNVRYIMTVNNNVDLLICCCLNLMLHDTTNSNSDEVNDVNYDFGNIGPEEFEFNKDWKPI